MINKVNKIIFISITSISSCFICSYSAPVDDIHEHFIYTSGLVKVTYGSPDKSSNDSHKLNNHQSKECITGIVATSRGYIY